MVKSKFNLLKVIIAVCVLSLAFSLASAFAVKAKSASAETVVPESTEIAMVSGVSVKLSADGLKYRVLIGEDLYNDIIANEDKTLGILIFPTQYIVNNPSIIGNYHAALSDPDTYGKFAARDITVDKTKIYTSEYNLKTANGVLSSVKVANRDLAFTAVGYVYDNTNGGYTYATANSAKSLYKALSALYLTADAEDRAEYRTIFSSVYSWFGTENYPVIVDTSVNADQYNAIVEDVNNGVSFSGVYFKITNDLELSKGSALIGAGFEGTFTADSAIVKAVQEDNVIANFDYVQSAKRISIHDSSFVGTVEWLSSYQGQSGVVKLTSPERNWPFIRFTAENDVASYETAGYTHIKVKMYIPSARGIDYIVLGNDQAIRSVVLNNPMVTYDAWVDYYFEIEPFTYWWSRTDASKSTLWMHATLATSDPIYISEITACTWGRPAPVEGEVDIFGQAALNDVTFDIDHTPTLIQAVPSERPAGGTHASAVYDVTAGAKAYIAPRLDKEDYLDYYYFNLYVKVAGSGTITLTLFPDSAVAYTRTFAAGTWQNIQIRAELFLPVIDSLKDGSQAFFSVSGDVTKVALYEIVATTHPDHVAGNMLEIAQSSTDKFWSRTGSAYMYGSNFIESDKGKADDTYRWLVKGSYLATLNEEGNQWFNLRTIPTCAYSEFIQYDYIKFEIFLYDTTVGTSYNVHWKNTPVGTIKSAQWNDVYLPISAMLSTRHPVQVHNELEAFLLLFTESSLMISQSGAEMSQFSLYVRAMTFGYDTPTGTATTGSTYANMEAANFTSSHSAAISEGEFFGKNAVKIAYANTWQNVFVKPGVTYHQLQGYNTLKMTVYFENSTNMQLYFQGVYGTRTAGNQYFSYISNDQGVTHTDPGTDDPNGWYTFPANTWLTLELPIYQLKLKWFESGRTGDLADFIVRGRSFSAIYFAAMWLE